MAWGNPTRLGHSLGPGCLARGGGAAAAPLLLPSPATSMAPAAAPPAAAVEIICPPDRHISVEFQEIYGILKSALSVGERARFEEVAQLIESLYAQEFMVLRRSLKRNFLPFSMGAKDQPLTTRVEAGLPTSGDLDQREEKLVSARTQAGVTCRAQGLRPAPLPAASLKFVRWDSFLYAEPHACMCLRLSLRDCMHGIMCTCVLRCGAIMCRCWRIPCMRRGVHARGPPVSLRTRPHASCCCICMDSTL